MRMSYRPYEPQQEMLLPASLQDWLPKGHLAYFISDTVDALNLKAFYARYEGGGARNQPSRPALMVKVLVFGYATGVFSSRKIERRLYEDLAFRMLGAVVAELRPYLLGWKAYFGLAQTPKVWRKLHEWLCHRLRAIQLKHWRRPSTIYRELKALGAAPNVAKRVAANSRRWWRNRDGRLKTVLTIAHFDRLGVPRLS